MATLAGNGRFTRSRSMSMLLWVLGVMIAMSLSTAAASYTDAFSSHPWGSGTTGSFTTGTSSTGLSYAADYNGLFAWDGDGKVDCDAIDADPSGVASFTITSRDGKAFVFNSLEWDDDAGGATISGTGPELFTINVSSGGAASTRSPAGGSKLVTSVTVSSSNMWALMDNVSVELDVPGAAVYGSGNLITNGDSSPSGTDDTDLGTTATGTPVSSTFSISSIGDAALDLTGSPYVTISGSADFTITIQPTTDPIASGSSDTFTVQCNPTAAGSRTAIVSITNDSVASPYTFTVKCTGDADTTKPDVTINQAGGQADPTNGSPSNFTVVFNEAVTGFATGDVTLGGTAGATMGTVTGSGTTYNVAASGMTGDGTVTATIAAGVAQDGSSNTNNASTSTDNTVTYDTTDPTDPTPTSSSHTVSVWDNDDTVDIAISGAADTGSGVDGFEIEWDKSATWTPSETKEQEETWSGATFSATSDGDWYFHIATVDNAGNWTSTQHLGPFQIDTTPPSVPAGLDPVSGSYTTDTSPTLSWSASTDTGGSGIRTSSAYRVVVTGTPSKDYYANGTSYTPTLAEGTFTWKVYARDNAGNSSSYTSDTTLTIDGTQPDVTINQASGQADPATTSPVVFTAVFDEPIDDATFSDADVSLGGTATTDTVTVTEIAPNDDTTFSVSVVMTGDGTVTASIPAGGIEDFAGNTNTESTSTDNSVLYDGNKPNVAIDQAGAQSDPTNTSPVVFTAVFDEPIDDATFTDGDVSVGGTATTGAVTVTEIAPNDDTTFSVSVVVTADGTVIPTVLAGGVEDVVGNTNNVSTSTDNSVTVDTDAPAITGVDPNAATDADVGSISVSITFDEPMDISVNPSPTITGLITDPYTISGSAWSNGDQTWTGSFTLVDDNEKATGVYTISGFTDPAGNTMAANSAWSLEVDTTNPTAAITVSDLLITDVDAGGVFTVTIVFSEDVKTDGSADPTLVFSPDVVGGGSPTLINGAGSWEGTHDTYTVTFDLQDNNVDADRVTIDVIGAEDSSGNPQQDYAPVYEFEVDTLNPTVTSVAVSDVFIESVDVGDLFGVTVSFSEAMMTDGSANPVLAFTPAVNTTLSEVGHLWSPTSYEMIYDILDGNVIEIGVDVTVDGAKDEHGNALASAHNALDYFDIDTLTPVPVDAPDIAVVPMGTPGYGAFLDRCLDLTEGEVAPMIGEFPLSAIYEVGEFVTGACNICDLGGATVRGSFVHVYVYSVDATSRPEELTLVEHWTVHYDVDTGCYSFGWDTTDFEPGYYDIRLFFADWTAHTCRIQLIEPVE